MKTCIDCSHPTNRHDNLCPNCYYIRADSDNPQSPIEALTIPHYGYTCACGENRTRVLVLMCKGGPFLQSGPPRTDRPNPRNKRAFQVAEDSSLWYAKCWNCLKATNHPGRPKKYTDDQRKWNRKNRSKVYLANLNTRVIQSYGAKGVWPHCVMCDQPATRVLYVGEFGKAPLGNHYWRCRRLAITDPHWHSQFLPYCDHHEVSNIGQRKVQKTQLVQAQIAEALWKSSRTLAEIEARQ